jgi:hypothetical protein
MSKYGEFITTIKDEACLLAALDEMGFIYERHDDAQTLYGYQGDARKDKANVIIRRQNTGMPSSNDVGFLRREDGTYQAVISDYDRASKFTDSWMATLKRTYQEKLQVSAAKRRGYVYQGREVIKTAAGERVRLSFGVR